MKNNQNLGVNQNLQSADSNSIYHNKYRSSFLLSTSKEMISPSLSKNNSTVTFFDPPKTKLHFYQYGYGGEDNNKGVNTKYIDFSSLISTSNLNETPISNRTSRLKNMKSKSVCTQSELIGIPNNINRPENRAFKPPPQMDTIKNREKRTIRNKKLSVDEIILPKINYITQKGSYGVKENLKVPDIWKSDYKIREQVQQNYMKTLLHSNSHSNSPSRGSFIDEFEPEKNMVEEDSNDDSYESGKDSSEKSHNSSLDSRKLIEKIEKDIPNLDVFRRVSNIYDHFMNEQAEREENKNNHPLRKQRKLKTIDRDQEFEIRVKKKEIKNLKNESDRLSNNQFGKEHEYLNALFHKVEKDHLRKDETYRKLKDAYEKYKMRNILNDKDFSMNSKLYVLNKNPLFQINNMTSFPNLVEDSNILANIYNINMYRLEKMANKYKEREGIKVKK